MGLAAGVGRDLPPSCRQWLDAVGIDGRGLIECDLPTLRAWQIFEEDGRRTQVWRVPEVDAMWRMLRPSLATLPADYQTARAYHAGVNPSGRDAAFIRSLRAARPDALVSIEPYTRAESIVPRSELRALVGVGHIFSPNEEEAASLVGPGAPLEVIGRLAELGAEVVALRRGAQGSVVFRADTGEAWDIPALYSALQSEGAAPPPPGVTLLGLVDVTGCGNAYCGGFLSGWRATGGNLLAAGLCGSVAASFMLEHEGVPPPLSERRAEAELRAQVLRPLTTRLQ